MTPPRRFTSPHLATFTEWLDNAPAGSTFIYHVGYLAIDRGDPLSGRLIEPTHTIAVVAALAEEKGRVLLTQRKHGLYHYDYIAMKRSNMR